MKLCKPVTDMKKQILDYSISGYVPDLYFDKNGNPTGIWMNHIQVLKDFMNFTVNLHIIPDFDQQVQAMTKREARLGSPLVATFQ